MPRWPADATLGRLLHMTATIHTLTPRQPQPTVPALTLDQLRGFNLPDPTWVSEDMRSCGYRPEDAAAILAWFAALGFDVDPAGSPESHGEGWAYLVGELAPAWEWKLHHPATFKALCGGWPQVQHDYLAALMAGDVAKVRELAHKTTFAVELRNVMSVESGCALR